MKSKHLNTESQTGNALKASPGKSADEWIKSKNVLVKAEEQVKLLESMLKKGVQTSNIRKFIEGEQSKVRQINKQTLTDKVTGVLLGSKVNDARK